MRSFILLVAVSACYLSCGSGPSVPSDVLPQEKMKSVLWDLLRAEQFVSNYVVSRDTTTAGLAKGPQLYDAILKKYGLTDSAFQVSLEYYKKHPKLLNPILDSIGQQPALAPTPVATAVTDSTSPASAAKSTADTVASLPTPTSTPTPKTSTSRPSFAPKPMAY
ncbi:MAG: hypothetical protein RL447_433 [Bacteroidota bacterium]|jgi:hypothetical protein